MLISEDVLKFSYRDTSKMTFDCSAFNLQETVDDGLPLVSHLDELHDGRQTRFLVADKNGFFQKVAI